MPPPRSTDGAPPPPPPAAAAEADAEDSSLLLGADAKPGPAALDLDVLGAVRPPTPAWAWGVLALAVCAVSSAAAVFSLMGDVPPLTLAAWRLQLTAVLLSAGAAAEARALPHAARADTRSPRTLALLAASGAALAFHFGLWVYSIKATTLQHSLLFVSCAPLLLAGGALALRHPISRGEVGGAALGAAGAAVLAAGAAAGAARGATLRGDAAALAAAAAVIPYLLVGHRLRSWMPLCCYAAPVTAVGAALLTAAAAAAGARPGAAGAAGLFGWAASRRHGGLVLYLALGPGIVGHTGINAVLLHLDPLVVALAMNAEPLLGSAIGAALGVAAPPGVATLLGGALVLAAAAWVAVAGAAREARAAPAARADGL
jgi:drug/metabolite transporter (DMT)-like permease